MSITLQGQPGVPSPGYNRLVYYVLSNQINQPGFRYVWKAYVAGTSTLIGTWRTAPRSQDGIGELDLQKVMSNYLTYTKPFTNTTSIDATGSYTSYDVKLYEEYNIPWTYQDFQYVSTGTWTGYTKLTQTTSTQSHSFVAGDQVNISTTTTGVTAPINGLHTVVNVPNSTTIIIDIKFPGSGGVIGGTVKYADNRKTLSSLMYTFSNQFIFNGALPFSQFPTYSPSSYTLAQTSTNIVALTNLPYGTDSSSNALWCTPTQDLTINFGNSQYDTSARTQTIRFTNSNGDVLTRSIWTGGGQGYVRQIAVGPNNANPTTVVSGTIPLLKSNTEWIEFEMFSPTQTTSKKYRYYIDRRCRINTYDILFMDRMGSFLSYSFQLRSKETGQITRDDYKQRIGDFVTNKYSYNLYDLGTTVYNSSVEKTYELNTDWMNDRMSTLFEELLTSPYVFIKTEGGSYYSCTVQEKGFTVERQKNKKLIKKTITVNIGNQNNINI